MSTDSPHDDEPDAAPGPTGTAVTAAPPSSATADREEEIWLRTTTAAPEPAATSPDRRRGWAAVRHWLLYLLSVLRNGAFLAAIVLLVLLVQSGYLHERESATNQVWLVAALGVAAGCVFVRWYRVVPRLMVALAFLLALAPLLFLTRSWWEDYLDTGYSNASILYRLGILISLLAAVLCQGIRLTLNPRGSATSSMNDGRSVGTMLVLKFREVTASWYRMLRCALSAAGAVVVCLVVISLLLLGEASVVRPINPVTHVTVPPQASAPAAIPESVNGEVAWSRVLEGSLTLALYRGAQGSVLVTQNEAQGLSAQDGSTTWSYSNRSSVIDSSAISPDGGHVVLVYGPGSRPDEHRTRAIILDTSTGAIVVDRWLEDPGSAVQLTNSMALLGTEGVSLEDGETQWRLEWQAASAATNANPGGGSGIVPRTAGRSTFVLPQSYTRSLDQRIDVYSVLLVSDSDPADTRVLDGVVTESWMSGAPTLVEGWTVRRSESDPTLLEAVSVDNGQTVPLGQYVGADPVASVSRLVLFAQDDTQEQADDGAEDGGAPSAYASYRITAVFDVGTGTITEVDGPAMYDDRGEDRQDTTGWPTQDTGVTRVRDSLYGSPLEIARNDGSESIVVPLPSDLRADPVTSFGYKERGNDSAVVAAPGGVVIAWRVYGSQSSGIVLICMH